MEFDDLHRHQDFENLSKIPILCENVSNIKETLSKLDKKFDDYNGIKSQITGIKRDIVWIKLIGGFWNGVLSIIGIYKITGR